jgi:hypothetical protein
MPGERAGLEDDPQLREARWLGEAITSTCFMRTYPSCSLDSEERAAFRASLSLRMPMKVQCFRCPASVHSTKAIWQTSFGLTQRHSFIFSAVSASPHREVLFSGRLVNGQCVAPAFLSTGKISFRIRGIRQEGSVLYFRYFRESACSVSMVVTAKRSAIDGALVQECIF